MVSVSNVYQGHLASRWSHSSKMFTQPPPPPSQIVRSFVGSKWIVYRHCFIVDGYHDFFFFFPRFFPLDFFFFSFELSRKVMRLCWCWRKHTHTSHCFFVQDDTQTNTTRKRRAITKPPPTANHFSVMTAAAPGCHAPSDT